MAWYRSATIWFCRRWFMIDSRLGLQMKATDNSSMQRGLFSCRRVFMLPLLKKSCYCSALTFLPSSCHFLFFTSCGCLISLHCNYRAQERGGQGATLATHYFTRVYFQPFLHCYFQGFWLNYPVKLQIKVWVSQYGQRPYMTVYWTRLKCDPIWPWVLERNRRN